MNDIIYLKKVDNYDDVLKKKYKRMPLLFKKFIYLYKNVFNIITKQQIEDINMWVLPLQEKYSNDKISILLKKISRYSENTFVLSKDLESNNLYKLMNIYNINYLNGNRIKTFLSIKMLEYINKIQ